MRKRYGASLTMLPFILTLAAAAAADECRVGCNQQKRDCTSTARVTMLSCKQDCRANVPPTERGTCQRACVDTFRADKTTCKTDHTTCREMCEPTPPEEGPPTDSPPSSDKACLAKCGKDLGACARDVTKQARECVRGCRTAPDKAVCLAGCSETAKADGAACGPIFEACVLTCGVPPEPTAEPTP